MFGNLIRYSQDGSDPMVGNQLWEDFIEICPTFRGDDTSLIAHDEMDEIIRFITRSELTKSDTIPIMMQWFERYPDYIKVCKPGRAIITSPGHSLMIEDRGNETIKFICDAYVYDVDMHDPKSMFFVDSLVSEWPSRYHLTIEEKKKT